ncbi:MAG TPA: helix-turn-helix transcriptional regulator [Anaerolineales bacterium]|nr:helix-turn-helix transcriptional regulator [Anaerolineales bacterium]
MGSARPRPKHLAAKLLKIRLDLGISQSQMVRRLNLPDPYTYCFVSKYELDRNEPPLMVLLAYAKVAGVPVENLIDDDQELGEKINN